MDIKDRLIEALSGASLLVLRSGKILCVNKAAADLIELPQGKLRGESLFDYLKSGREEFADYLRTCARNAQPVPGALVLRRGDGESELSSKGALLEPAGKGGEATVLLQLFPRLEANRRFVLLKERIEELNQEVVRRQRSEHALRAQKEWLQVTLSSIGDAVIVTDAEGVVSFLNPVAQRLTGWSQEAASGKKLAEVFRVVHEGTGLPLENPVEHVLRERKIVSLANNSLLVPRTGREIPIADTAAPIHVGERLEGVVLVFHDVTEKRHLQQQLMERASKLEEANQRKNEFLMMLAHELRNPLAPITNAVELLNYHGRPELSVQAREILARQIQHLTRITDDLLDVSRIMRGKINIVKERLDLAELLRHSSRDGEPQFLHRGVRLSLALPERPLWVDADPTRISQVVENLMSNACKFTPSGGQVEMTLGTKGGYAVLRVSDTGEGIETSLMPHLFEPFAQAAQSLSRTSGGLGLGLSIIKGIVEQHNGKVFAESAGKGQGAAFTVMLPLSRDVRISQAPKADEEKGGVHKVLLIEDNVDSAETLRLLLDCLGHEVHVAATGPEGIDKARALHPGVIICDIGLPGMDGFAVAQKLREDPATASALLIALTGYGDRSFETRAREVGFDHHLVKPVKIEVIAEVIKTLH